MPSFIEKAEKYLRYDRFVYIPNAVSIPAISAQPGIARKVHTITNVGRITGRTKRQHLLVEAFASLAKDFPDWQVNLWGDTYDKTYVTTLKGIIKSRDWKAGFIFGAPQRTWLPCGRKRISSPSPATMKAFPWPLPKLWA